MHPSPGHLGVLCPFEMLRSAFSDAWIRYRPGNHRRRNGSAASADHLEIEYERADETGPVSYLWSWFAVTPTIPMP